MDNRRAIRMQREHEYTGRKGLFTITSEEAKQKGIITHDENLEEIIAKISSYKDGDFPTVPEKFIALLERIQKDAESITNANQEIHSIQGELQKLTEEHASLKKEHESYLSDLISAHTEFDRSLEIFQYHEIPMVIVGKDQQVMDANDKFCSIFAVERSEIIRQFPLITRYIPEQKPFIAPDEKKYTTVSLKPPILPFDHEAVSLELLIQHSSKEKFSDIDKIPYQILENALNETLLPVTIVDEYNIVQFVNPALLFQLAREKQFVTRRDIASCGFDGEIVEKINEVRVSWTRQEFQTSIYHRDNTIIHVWTQLIPLEYNENKYILIVLLPDEEEPDPILTQEYPKSTYISSTYVKTLIDINPNPIVLFDSDTKIVHANEGLSELIGVSSDLLKNQKLSDIGFQIPDASLFSEDIEILPDEICIESPYGVQCYSGLLIPGNSEEGSSSILILQPPLHNEERPQNDTQTENVPVELPSPEMSVDSTEKISSSISVYMSFSIPLILIDNENKMQMNEEFLVWSGITYEKFSEYEQGIFLLLEELVKQPDKICTFSFPHGKKSFRINIQNKSGEQSVQIYWFIDQTREYEHISELQSQVESVKKELTTVRSSLSNEQVSIKNSENLIDQIDIVEFELSGSRYAMDIGMVREVVEMLPITPLPKTPPYIIGIINLRGEVTHVVDLSILLGEGIKKDRTGQKIIIVPPDAAHGEHLGIVVDNVRSVTEIGVKQVTALGEEINNRIQTRIKGIIKVTHDDLIDKREGTEKDANLVIWLDMKEILNRLAGFH